MPGADCAGRGDVDRFGGDCKVAAAFPWTCGGSGSKGAGNADFPRVDCVVRIVASDGSHRHLEFASRWNAGESCGFPLAEARSRILKAREEELTFERRSREVWGRLGTGLRRRHHNAFGPAATTTGK